MFLSRHSFEVGKKLLKGGGSFGVKSQPNTNSGLRLLNYNAYFRIVKIYLNCKLQLFF